MTPFGIHLRQLRLKRGVTQKQMAGAIGVSPAYLSALEHGKRGTPSYPLLQRIVGYLNIIWDDAERLQELGRLSNPRVVIDTSQLSATATKAANTLAQTIAHLEEGHLEKLLMLLQETPNKNS